MYGTGHIPENPMKYDLEAGNGTYMEENKDDEATIRFKKQVELGLYRKVFGNLTVMLLITASISAIFMYNKNVQNYVIAHQGWVWVSYILLFINLFAAFAYRQHHPTNICLLYSFSVLTGYMVGVVCAVYDKAGYRHYVALAAIATISIFIILTAFTMKSNIDFSFLNQILGTALSLMIIWGIIIWITGYDPGIGYSIIGSLIFALYIIADVYRLKTEKNIDDWILICLDLYLDIINLFLYLLDLITRMNE